MDGPRTLQRAHDEAHAYGTTMMGCMRVTDSACVSVQVYTYLLRPLTAPGRTDTMQRLQQRQQQQDSSTVSSSDADHLSGGRQGSGTSEATVGYELQLVMEYCPLVRTAVSWILPNISCSSGQISSW
jgi:hypothetical protein